MRARRALLYVPGDDRRKIEKAAALGADCVCLDLEDGVAASRKVEARTVVTQAMQEVYFRRSERCIRINSPGSGLEKEDIKAALSARPDAIVVPKVEKADQVQWAACEIEAYELREGLPLGGIRLLVGVETPLGILNLREICAADRRLEAVIFGGEDFAAAVGATRTRNGVELLYARSAVIVACAAHGLQAIDIVYIDYRDTEGLRAEAEQGARMGFAGKQVIHPSQIAPVQAAFTPSDDAIAQARRVVETFEASQKEGRGAYGLDGKMIDRPLYRAAQNVLERARAAGKTT